MENAPVEKCLECHLPKSQDGVYSLTQWIAVCSCGLVTSEEEQKETVDFCAICNKRVLKARKGSFTQWIFRSDLCNCENPQIVERKPKTETSDQVELFEDESLNETEISLDDEYFPLDRFKPIGILGEGTSGNVYLCRDRILNKRVAVKCLRFFSAQAVVDFQKEAKINTRLEHPNIAKVIDFGVHKEQKPYMVVEYINGLSLEHHLEAHGVPDIKIALTLLVQICKALSYAHSNNIYHRDIKLANVLFLDSEKDDPKVSVIDFGLAQMNATGDIKDDTNSVVGTPGYMAPDTVQGLIYDEQSEVYSIGCLAFELLTGRLPFVAESSLDVLNKHATEEVPTLAQINKDRIYTQELERVVAKCLEKEKSDRFSSVSELGREFEEILEEGLFQSADDSGIDSEKDSILDRIYRIAKAVSLVVVPVGIALVGGNYYYSNFVKNRITHKEIEIESEKKLISPKTDMEQKLEYVIVASKPKFSVKEGFMHPDNVLGFEDEDMKYLKGKNYDSISFYGASVTGEGLRYLVDEPIQRLSIDYTAMTDESYKYINQMKNLKVLSSEYVSITDKAIENMQDLKGLKIITLNGDKNITDKSVEFMVEHFPELIKVSFLGTKVTDSGVVKLGQLKHLQEIYLNYTKVGDKSVKAICKPPLQVLLLSSTMITDKSLDYIADCKTIREIALTDCQFLSRKGLVRLRTKRPRLKINTHERYDNFSFDLLNSNWGQKEK